MSRVLKKLLPEDSISENKKPNLSLVPPPFETKQKLKKQSSKAFQWTIGGLGVAIASLLGLQQGWFGKRSERGSGNVNPAEMKVVAEEISSLKAEMEMNREAIRYFQAENYQEAKVRFEKLAKIYSESPSILVNLAMTYFRLKEYKIAKVYFLKALDLNTSNTIALNNLGMLSSALGKYEEAKEYFDRAIQIDPTFADSRLNLGKVFEKTGQPLHAIEQYQAYVSGSSGDPVVKRLLSKRIEKLGAIARYFDEDKKGGSEK